MTLIPCQCDGNEYCPECGGDGIIDIPDTNEPMRKRLDHLMTALQVLFVVGLTFYVALQTLAQ